MNESEVKAQTELKPQLKPQEVADYLEQHPDFFTGKDDLLLKLTLPHRRGEAVSLVERQIALLREGNVDYRHRLACLSETAKDNERLFERMRKLVLMLLESRDLEQLLETIADSLSHEFNIELHSLILFSEKPMNLPVRIEHLDVATRALGKLLEKSKPECGQFEDEELGFLFPEQEKGIGSVAVIPLIYSLNEPQQLGVLALASKDPEHFQEGVGSLFTGYIGDVLSRMLAMHT